VIGQIDVKTRVWLLACLMSTQAGDLAGQEPTVADVPLVELRAAPVSGVEVSAKAGGTAGAGTQRTSLSFANPLSERRIAALDGVPAGDIDSARALAFHYHLLGANGEPWPETIPPIVAVFFEHDGGAWYCIRESGSAQKGDVRMPLRGARFRRAAFASDEDEAIRLEQVERVWLGLLVDGPAEGLLLVSRVRFTDEAFRPDSPIDVSRGTRWDVAQDSAVQGTLTRPDLPTTEYRFDMPGGRHMYAMVRTPVDVDELDAYSGLRFKYQADLPQGIEGLLVMLIERDGTQYRAVPSPPVSGDWKTVTIPFSKFERGGWSKDENDGLDLEDVSHLSIGMHGTTPKAASGTINVSSPQFVP
jgi:hypothetical protein